MPAAWFEVDDPYDATRFPRGGNRKGEDGEATEAGEPAAEALDAEAQDAEARDGAPEAAGEAVDGDGKEA